MVNVDFSRLSDYLNVDREKLASKGVSSVRARVANLSVFSADITIASMTAQMRAAFGRVYGGTAQPLPLPDPQAPEFAGYIAQFASDAWIYGVKTNFDYSIHKRFSWGDFELNVTIQNGCIAGAQVYSDALDEQFIRDIAARLPGLPYNCGALSAAISALAVTDEQAAMAHDLDSLLFLSI